MARKKNVNKRLTGSLIPKNPKKKAVKKKPVATKKQLENVIKKNEKTAIINSKKSVKEIKKKIRFGNGKKDDISDFDIINALMERGTIAGASKILNCGYASLSNRIKKNPNILEILEMKQDGIINVLESYAIDNMLTFLMAGDFNASKLVLEKRCGWNGDPVGLSFHGDVLSDQDIKNKIENMTQEERETRILELQEKLINKKIINVTPAEKKIDDEQKKKS